MLLTALTLGNPLAAAPPTGRTPTPAAASVRLNGPEKAFVMAAFEQHVALSYAQAGLSATGLPLDVYRRALIGFYHLQQRGTTSAHILSIIDFSRSSTQKRLWTLDLAKGKLLHHTLVAHGKYTGEEFAQNFSNREGSEMSSLGFYVTGATYQGKHGLSLKLHGVDAGYNTNALSRAVVVHGADYVSQQFIRQHGRLGRSQGCPALPVEQTPAIIRTIKGGTVLFANGPAYTGYRSNWLSLDPALVGFARSKGLLGQVG
ncbi:hypothetical protein HNQ93_002355 [Hymenobacter luteus]|uniref:Murein L,D-transpeptidase catalytic domain family protein n=2 Tax=Hymenobacter TaxID=89966 RepID=A0A7W9WCH1_9BACT|nr:MULTISPECIES: murein L,D-transpeptidase catalytic domain family protein [Hymenobacter]MBB4602076.1 hypothetical protein [Hymenobacter latericoloratus]MBB6059495.1 hypothetical protein [Hymenobacter luteus]